MTPHEFTAKPVSIPHLGRRVDVACSCGLACRVTPDEVAEIRARHEEVRVCTE